MQLASSVLALLLDRENVSAGMLASVLFDKG